MTNVLPVKQDDGSKNLRCHISSTTALLWCAAGMGSWTPFVHYLRRANQRYIPQAQCKI